MNKIYNPKDFEDSIFNFWISKKLNCYKFNDNTKKNFCVVLAPPNVTGVLHIGHAWDSLIQDCIIRYKKLIGFNTNWIPGLDHAGIATQTKYESYLRNNNIDINQFDRELFIENLYQWAMKNGNNIVHQWKKLGLLLDFNQTKFTLDEKISDYVMDLFIKLYNDKLVYQKKKLVNWDVKLQTAISNIEVINKDVETKLYYFKYYIKDSNNYLEVATTRPETMFADTCLVVNPNDLRYKKYINLFCINPANNEFIPIISDNYVDIDYGTGVMKCTPAHDFNDYKIGLKYKQKFSSCMNLDGTMNDLANEFKGYDRLECRKLLVDKLKNNNFLTKISSQISSIGFSERTDEIIEPMLSKQWFIKMKPLAKKILALQKNNKGVLFFPKWFEKKLLTWLNNIEDWCISRQLVWGHRLPIWYNKKNKKIIVTKQKMNDDWQQDCDVFDTWFSSGMWPYVVFDRKNDKVTFKNNFPTDLLVTAYDIIFFWVSRMMMLSYYDTKKIPFKHIFIHGLIRDENNRKMSKSLGNGVVPEDIINEYGVDALKLFLLSNTSIGDDLIFSQEKIKGASLFLNKMWNIAKYINNFDKDKIDSHFSFDYKFKNEFDNWILERFSKLIKKYHEKFKLYQFNILTEELVKFIKNDFSSIYIELNKYRFNDYDFINLSYYLFLEILKLFHPFSSFVTEKIYQDLYAKNSLSILETKILLKFKKIKSKNIDSYLKILEFIRKYKWDNKLDKKFDLTINVICNNLADNIDILNEILKTQNTTIDKNIDIKDSEKFQLGRITIYIKNNDSNLKNIENKQKQIDFYKKEIERSEKILSNENFIKKAPSELVKKEKNKLADYKQALKKILEA